MLRMILRRLMLGAITVGLVSLIIFLAIEALPGDACTALLKQDAQGQRLLNCRQELGLDRAAPLRYLDWASAASMDSVRKTWSAGCSAMRGRP